MTNLLNFLFLILVLSGCGRGLAGPPIDHGQFESYFQMFESESIAHGRDTYGDNSMEIVMGTLPSTVEVGVCEVDAFGRKITIDQASWLNLDEGSRQNLIFHELGHCILNLNHDNSLMSSGLPDSLMNAMILPRGVFMAFRVHYMDQLFEMAR